MADDEQVTACECGESCECEEEAKPKKTKARKTAKLSVRTITDQGETSLVEWAEADGLHRAYVPTIEVQDGQASSDVLAAGIGYGVAFEDIWQPSVTATQVAQEFRRRGLWTEADVRRAPMRAIAALQAAYRYDLAALLAAMTAPLTSGGEATK